MMANLTIVVDDEILRRARIRAAEQGTSVNAALAAYLAHFAGATTVSDAMTAFLEIVDGADAGSGSQGRTWRRNDLYE
jgi:hypothetical protein